MSIYIRTILLVSFMMSALVHPVRLFSQLTDTTRVAIHLVGDYYEMENGYLGVRIPTSSLFNVNEPDFVPAPIRCVVYRNGTLSNDFPNFLISRTPALTFSDTILYQTTDSCSIRISYTFDKPALNTGAGQSEPAGPGYYHVTLRMIKGEKACMVTEESDYEVGFEMKVSDGLTPDKGRYQGHQSTSIENGYDVNGNVYQRGSNEGYQATVDLDFTKRKNYPKTARWNPFVINSGWHWQLYDSLGSNEANTFGIFDGRTSVLLGAEASGVSIFTEPAAVSDLHAACDTSGNCHFVWLTEDELWYMRTDSTGASSIPELIATGFVNPFVFAYGNTVNILVYDPFANPGNKKKLIRKIGNGAFQTFTLNLDGVIEDPYLYGASNGTHDFVMFYGTRNGDSGLLLYAADFNQTNYTFRDSLDEGFANRGANRPDMKLTPQGDIVVTYAEGVFYQSYNVILKDSIRFNHDIPFLPFGTAALTFGNAADPRSGDIFYVRSNGALTYVDLDRDSIRQSFTTSVGAFTNYTDEGLPNRRNIATDLDSNAFVFHEGYYFWFDHASHTWSALTGPSWDAINPAHIHFNPHTNLFYIVGKYNGSLARFRFNGSGTPVLDEIYQTTSKPLAGIKSEHKRVAPTGNYYADIRFQWGLFAGKKGSDLEAVDEVQTIARLQNRLSGLANKLDGYENDTLGFNATFENGGVYMSSAAFQAIKQKVIEDNDYYQLLSSIDTYFKPVMDAWRDPGNTQTTAVFQSIVNDVMEIKDALTSGDGIYDIEYMYSGGANRMRRMGDQIIGLLADTKLTTIQRDSLKKIAGLFARILWDDDFVPLFVEHGMSFGTPNTPQAYTGHRWFFALNLSTDPEFSARAAEVPSKMQEILNNTVNLAGATRGSPHYLQIPMDLLGFAALQLKAAGLEDKFQTSIRLRMVADFILHLMTPNSVRFDGNRKLVAFGDGSEESAAVFGLMATGFADIDTVLSRQLMYAYRNGAARGSDYGFITLAINHNLPDTTGLPLVGMGHFPGYLSTMRSGVDTDHETATWFINGEWYFDHRNDDRGAVSIYALGAPLALNYGSFFQPWAPGAHMKNSVVTEAAFPQWDQPNQPLILPNNQMWDNSYHQDFVGLKHSGYSKAIFNSDSAWTRTVIQFSPSIQTPLIWIEDELRDTTSQHVWNCNFMSKGNVGTPAGVVTPPSFLWDRNGGPYQHPSAGNNFPLPPGIRKFEFTGADWNLHPAGGIDWELYLPSDSTHTANLCEWSHTFIPSNEASEFLSTNGTPFKETQTILRVRGKKKFIAFIVPYHKGARPANLTVTQNGEYLEVECDSFSFHTNGLQYTYEDSTVKVLTTYTPQTLSFAGATIQGGAMELEIRADLVIARLHGDPGVREVSLPAGTWAPLELSSEVTYNANTGFWELTHTDTTDVTNSFEGKFREIIFVKSVRLSPKILLQGAFQTQTGLMSDQLRTSGYIPLMEPYTGLNFTHVLSGGGETILPSVLDTTGNNAIVDWVFLELRDKNDPGIVLATRSALLQRDGDIVETDGMSPVAFQGVSGDAYYIGVRHRNHLGIRSTDPVVLSGAPANYDFTLSMAQAFGTDPMINLGGAFGLWGGNARYTDTYVRAKDQLSPPPVLFSDSNYILDVILNGDPEATLEGYHTGDVNMDGKVRAKPKIFPPPVISSDVTFILDNVLGGNPDLTKTQQ